MTDECPKCHDMVPESQIETRFSYGVYAGKFCEKCCYTYADACGLGGYQGSPSDLDEPYWEEEWL